ncbi:MULTISPECIES: HigA family addiction module antitoxin [Methylobacterium]|jgi:addiction module HigA family antidote|uniref:HigA family addiction module antitoxin n=1 Tax=Methylobacterium TaxID=407 RepID=UPI0011C80362|nr:MULTISPECIES: HigA family addiction module antitoxin [Methylobacterium]TXN36416.1 HigA family addiction module antidote protein [Methylobacterium sp. WL7]TXN54353.1 HigA family addiction module antidote protein [Methylobacterium sp. WL18]GJE22947.1 hypothetical protein JHFBIEKO_3407 [Methylobacterium mesophilicum]
MNSPYVSENPCHPGGFVRRNVLEPRNLAVMAAASLLNVTRQTLSDFLNEKAPLTAELALRIEKVFGSRMEMLMEMQTRFDISRARKLERRVERELAGRTGVQPPTERTQVIVKRVHAFG